VLGRYIIQRLMQLIPVLFLVSLIVFLIVHMIPGDPILVMLGVDPEVGASYSEDQYRALEKQLGFDQPVYVQYFRWLGRVLRGDLGLSLQSRRPVLDILLERYPATIYLAFSAFITVILISLPAGIIAAVRQNTIVDYSAMGYAMWGMAIPNFWLALMLILLFSLKLGIVPSIGYASPMEDPFKFLQHVSLPAIVLGTSMAASVTRYMRAEMLEQLSQDYVRTARAKGLPPRMVIVKHAAKNSMISIVTILGLDIARLLGGSTIIETVFTWPGVASLLLEGIYGRDYPIVQGAVLIIALTYVAINLVVDILYKWLDPRIKLE
jgi:peptide/nickel transport system permease protein